MGLFYGESRGAGSFNDENVSLKGKFSGFRNFAEGYAKWQGISTVGALYSCSESEKSSDRLDIDYPYLYGAGVSAAQDAICAVFAASYICGNDSLAAKIGAAVTGFKIISNTTAFAVNGLCDLVCKKDN